MSQDESFERRVAEQHRLLDGMFASVLEAVSRDGAEAGARAAFSQLREALEVHFDQEERLHYPAVRLLSPGRGDAVAAIVRAHESFRAQLEGIESSLAATRTGEAEQRLRAFVDAFAAHEAAEEGLLRSLDQEIEAASSLPPPPSR
jgi:hemerythrin